MSVADRSIDPRIMESAKEEFLQKGFLDASLQVICKNAGVTTGALYKRFKGKEELFCALVESTVQDLERLLLVFSDGTKYANFEHEWVESMSHTTYAYYKEAQRRGLTKTDISEKEMHVMLSSFWTAICEPLVHGFSKKEAGRISDLMCGLFDWYKMLGFER